MAKMRYATHYYNGKIRVSLTAQDLVWNICELDRDTSLPPEQRESLKQLFNVMLGSIAQKGGDK